MICDGCANEGTQFCMICVDGDFHRTEDEKEYEDWMCDLLCGKEEDDGDN